MSKIGMSMLASKGNISDVWKVDIYFYKLGGLEKQRKLSFMMSEKTRKLQIRSCVRYNSNLQVRCLKFDNGGEYNSRPIKFFVENRIAMLKIVSETPLQFGVTERLSRTFRAESMGIRAEALKMLWADSVSTTYLIYRIPYVPIGLNILEEEWRGKDTSLAHLKEFGYDLFVKVKDVCEEAMKYTFIGSGSGEVQYSFWDMKSHQVIQSRDITFVDSIYEARSMTDSSILTKPIQKTQVVLVDITENLVENGNIFAEHGLSSEITQSPGGSSDTSEGSENNGSFKDSGRSDEEYSEDGASSKEGGSETPYNGELESYSEALSSKESVQWEKAIIKEMVSLEKNQTCSLVRLSAGKKTSQRLWMFKVKEEQNGSKGYKARLVVKGFQQKRGVDYNEIFSPVVRMTTIKLVLSIVAARAFLYSWNEEPCSDVHQVGNEREVEVLRSFNGPPSELITDDGVLPERGYSQFNDVSSGYLVSKVS
ncbi:retrovirus-related pol polyprotein from transposon TNT 1-94 [Tanacetum coccineum]